jgi:hypothetical protein
MVIAQPAACRHGAPVRRTRKGQSPADKQASLSERRRIRPSAPSSDRRRDGMTRQAIAHSIGPRGAFPTWRPTGPSSGSSVASARVKTSSVQLDLADGVLDEGSRKPISFWTDIIIISRQQRQQQ